MERQNKGIFIITVILAVAVLAMSVGFAAFTQNLDITGSAKVDPVNWSVHFNQTSATKTSVRSTKPSATKKTPAGNSVTVADLIEGDITVSNTSVSYTAHLYDIGDEASFTVDIVNDGDFDAKLDSFNISTVDKPYIEYSVTYADGTAIATNDELNAGETKKVKVTLKYIQPTGDQSTSIPQGQSHADDVVIENITATFGYVQK